MEYGFHGLGGRFKRAEKFHFDEEMAVPQGAAFRVIFKRDDSGEMVEVSAFPSIIPLEEEDIDGSRCMSKVVDGVATPDERGKFFRYWQGKNRKILLDPPDGLFQVGPASDYKFH